MPPFPAGWALGRASPRDGGVDRSVQCFHRPPVAEVAWRRQPLRHDAERARPADDVIEHGQRRLRQRIRAVADLDAEQRLGDDLERDVHHLLGDVERLACRRSIPARQHRFGVTGHQRAEAGNALAVEGRLRQPPLPQPEIPVAGQQPAAGDTAQQIVLEGVLAVVPGVVLQHVLDPFGIADQVELPAPARRVARSDSAGSAHRRARSSAETRAARRAARPAHRAAGGRRGREEDAVRLRLRLLDMREV